MIRKVISNIILLIFSFCISLCTVGIIIVIFHIPEVMKYFMLFVLFVLCCVIFFSGVKIKKILLSKYNLSLNRIDSVMLLILINIFISIKFIEREKDIVIWPLLVFSSLLIYLIIYELAYKVHLIIIKRKNINDLIKYNELLKIGVLSQEEYDTISEKIKKNLNS